MQKIGIIVAMEEEAEAIAELMKDVSKEEVYNLTFCKGKIHNQRCILVQSGIGKVNAARTTQIMIDKYKVDTVINVGASGSINGLLNIGDVLIGKQVVQHDFDITAFGHSRGFITGIGNFIECDPTFIENIQKLLKNNSNSDYKIKLGIIATGDIFCEDVSIKDKIRANFDADVVDMECAAIGQVCYLDNIPFSVIRTISDTPNGNNASTFDDNLESASKRCANILNKYLKAIE